jgi:hypothetical protein
MEFLPMKKVRSEKGWLGQRAERFYDRLEWHFLKL